MDLCDYYYLFIIHTYPGFLFTSSLGACEHRKKSEVWWQNLTSYSYLYSEFREIRLRIFRIVAYLERSPRYGFTSYQLTSNREHRGYVKFSHIERFSVPHEFELRGVYCMFSWNPKQKLRPTCVNMLTRCEWEIYHFAGRVLPLFLVNQGSQNYMAYRLLKIFFSINLWKTKWM